MISDVDLKYLERSVELAREALETGNSPFGSMLVDGDGKVRFEDHNRIAGGDDTQHPEIAIARWAAENMSPEERAKAIVYTSGEHCAMCAAAHGWVGLGRIVYASSTEQLIGWLDELGAARPPITPLPINEVVPGLKVDGPAPSLAETVKNLHTRYLRKENG
ncbi:nucleoside deaminase [Marinobacter sp. VGCF2001]|uniref:nucleoside deaminase n=1 Tax=Marinobacter sp. VGCF2001 TaxID=3417189 RepID=UPI003CF555B5